MNFIIGFIEINYETSNMINGGVHKAHQLQLFIKSIQTLKYGCIKCCDESSYIWMILYYYIFLKYDWIHQFLFYFFLSIQQISEFMFIFPFFGFIETQAKKEVTDIRTIREKQIILELNHHSHICIYKWLFI